MKKHSGLFFYRVVAILGLAFGLLCCSSPEPDVDWSKFSSFVDLAGELHDATVLVETRRIDFGAAASEEYLLEGWSSELIMADGVSKLRASAGDKSALQFVVLSPRELKVTIRVGPAERACEGEQELIVELNGKSVQTIRLGHGLQDHRFTLPTADLVRGKNTLLLQSICPHSDSRQHQQVLWDYMLIKDGVPLEAPEQRGRDLYLPFGTAVRFLFELPSDGYLTLSGVDSGDELGWLDIRYRRFGGSRDFAVKELPSGAELHRMRFSASPSNWVWITLSAVVNDDAPGGNAGLLLRDLQIRSRDGVTTASVVRDPVEGQRSSPRRPNVIIYLVDTLRADHLGCYGYPKRVSPSIDAFASDAVLFEQTMAQTSWTRSAVASIFTGMVPPSHGVHDRKDGLAENAETLAEILRGAGYDTASFVATGHVSPKWGMAQGFETFELIRKNDMGLRYALSNGVNPPIFDWLDRDRVKPFFLYVHTLDPHSPYLPRKEAAERFAAKVREPNLNAEAKAELEKMRERLATKTGTSPPVTLGSQVWIQGLKRGVISSTPTMLEDLNALYDAEIYHNDKYFGEFLDYLRATGIYENSIIIFLSDHGEEFLDHGFWTHGHTLYQEQLRVPLIARFPDETLPRGERVTGLARQIDIAATVADYIGLAAPANSQGESLIPLALGLGAESGQRPGYAHLDLDTSFAETFYDGKMKLICSDRRRIDCQLFDLTTDPEERIDLAGSQPRVVTDLKKKMQVYLVDRKRFEAFEADPDEETRAQLEALGYVF